MDREEATSDARRGAHGTRGVGTPGDHEGGVRQTTASWEPSFIGGFPARLLHNSTLFCNMCCKMKHIAACRASSIAWQAVFFVSAPLRPKRGKFSPLNRSMFSRLRDPLRLGRQAATDRGRTPFAAVRRFWETVDGKVCISRKRQGSLFRKEGRISRKKMSTYATLKRLECTACLTSFLPCLA